ASGDALSRRGEGGADPRPRGPGGDRPALLPARREALPPGGAGGARALAAPPPRPRLHLRPLPRAGPSASAPGLPLPLPGPRPRRPLPLRGALHGAVLDRLHRGGAWKRPRRAELRLGLEPPRRLPHPGDRGAAPRHAG